MRFNPRFVYPLSSIIYCISAEAVFLKLLRFLTGKSNIRYRQSNIAYSSGFQFLQRVVYPCSVKYATLGVHFFQCEVIQRVV